MRHFVVYENPFGIANEHIIASSQSDASLMGIPTDCA